MHHANHRLPTDHEADGYAFFRETMDKIRGSVDWVDYESRLVANFIALKISLLADEGEVRIGLE